MGKKKRRNKLNQEPSEPFISVCTPTFNRRPFIKKSIECFMAQDYPMNKIEWLIYDDGTDKIEDLIKDIKNVRYFKSEHKLSLGAKRNFLHRKSKGDILVYMDDDDYYPPMRISHAVERLKSNPKALVAGSSEIYIYFNHLKKMYQFGPYGPNHATAGTFAIRRKFIASNHYESDAALAEEKHFLKNYTVPFVQLDPLKTILVFSHNHNTFDKKMLLNNPNNSYVKESNKTIDMFIKNKDMHNFYTNEIHELLKDYSPGDPSMKPDVLKQMQEIQAKRQRESDRMLKNSKDNVVIEMQQPDGKKRQLTIDQVVQLLQMQQKHIDDMKEKLKLAEIELAIFKSNSETNKSNSENEDIETNKSNSENENIETNKSNSETILCDT